MSSVKHSTTSQQRGIYFSSQLDERGIAYNLPGFATIDERIDIEKLTHALDVVIHGNEALRTCFIEEGGGLFQCIGDHVEIPIKTLAIHESQLPQTFIDFVEPFDLTKAPLLRFLAVSTDDRDFLFYDFHHIIADARTIELFKEDLLWVYNNGTDHPKRDQYLAYCESLEHYDYEIDRNYWIDKLGGELPVLDSVVQKTRPSFQRFNGARVYKDLSTSIADGITACAKTQRVTDSMLFMSVLTILLSRYTNQDDILFGMPTLNRSTKEDMNTMGLFVNTIVIRGNVRHEDVFSDFLSRMRHEILQSYSHQKYPFERIVSDLAIQSDRSRNPVFNILFEMLPDESLSSFKNGFPAAELGRSMFDLVFRIFKGATRYTVELEYNTDLFESKWAEKIIGHYINLIEEAITSPDSLVGDMDILNQDARNAIIQRYCTGPVVPYVHNTITGLWEEAAPLYAKKTALLQGGRAIAYIELEEYANGVANWLFSQGIREQDIVAVYGGRSIETLIAMLGIWKTGAVYLPIDSVQPKARMKFIISDSGAAALIASQSIERPNIPFLDFQDYLSIERASTIQKSFLETPQGRDYEAHIEGNLPLYCLYTSGTTGHPKGVIIPHRTIANLVQWQSDHYEVNGRVTAFTTSIGFDVSIQEAMLTLLNGGTGVIISDEEKKDIHAFSRIIRENHVACMFTTPSYFDVLTTDTCVGRDILDEIELIFLAGETFYINALCAEYVKASKVVCINDYGPTETHVISSGLMMGNLNSIGRPIGNCTMYILNGNAVTDIGLAGELCACGTPVALGYFERSDLQERKFVRSKYNGKVMFRTGDLAAWNEDGTIKYLGRQDDQVKIRGIRVELQEVQRNIQELSQISECVVLVAPDTGQNLLCAYITGTGDEKIDIGCIKEQLQKKLPEYMIPAYIQQLDSLPLTVNGKIDKRSLPAIQVPAKQHICSHISEQEQALCDLFGEVLGIKGYGLHNPFFEMGGDSLKAIKLLGLLKCKGFDLSIRDVINHSTPGKIADLLKSKSSLSVSWEEYPVHFDVNLELLDERLINLADAYDRNRDRNAVVTTYKPLAFQKYIMRIDPNDYDFVQGHMVCAHTIRIKGNVTISRLQEVVVQIIKEQSVLRTFWRQDDSLEEHVADFWEIPVIEVENYPYDELDRAFECLNNDMQYVSKNHLLSKLFIVKIHDSEYEIRYFVHHSVWDGMSHIVLASRVEEILKNGTKVEPECFSDYVSHCKHYMGGITAGRKTAIRCNIIKKALTLIVHTRKRKEYYVDISIRADECYMVSFQGAPLIETMRLYHALNYEGKHFDIPFLPFMNQRCPENADACGLYFDVSPIVYNPDKNEAYGIAEREVLGIPERYYRLSELFDLATVKTASSLIPTINYLGLFNSNVFAVKESTLPLDVRVTPFDSRNLKREKRITCYTIKDRIFFNMILSSTDESAIRAKVDHYFRTSL